MSLIVLNSVCEDMYVSGGWLPVFLWLAILTSSVKTLHDIISDKVASRNKVSILLTFLLDFPSHVTK